MATPLKPADRKEINAALKAFLHPDRQNLLSQSARNLMSALRDDPTLGPYIHFIKYRVKSADSLKGKLVNKARARRAEHKAPNITAANLFTKIGDLAAVRILHLHTEQIGPMAKAIDKVFDQHSYKVKEGPTAIVWDQEYRELYKSFGIASQTRNSMYTSVHYVVQATTKPPILVELQVRTLMEEVWGEVDHRVRYKDPTVKRACKDQLHVLARMTSGCTRLVDSIFKSSDED
jgi:putative GTP pyrophosphokinase